MKNSSVYSEKLLPHLYTLIRPLGAGGLSETFLAETPEGKRLVLKRTDMQRLLKAGEDFRGLWQGLERLKNLRHPQLAAVYDLFLADGCLWEAEEYAAGRTLRQLKRSRPDGYFSAGEILSVTKQLAEAAGFLHTNGLVHLDIQPDNILIDDKGRLKLVDFGSCRPWKETSFDRALRGTAGFAAPEMSGGFSAITPAADIYGTGRIMAYMLQKEDAGPHPGAASFSIHACTAEDLLIDRVIRACTAWQPEKRPASCSSLLDMLALSGEEKTRLLRRRQRRIPAMLLAALLMVMGLAGVSGRAGAVFPKREAYLQNQAVLQASGQKGTAPAALLYRGTMLLSAGDLRQACACFQRAAIKEKEEIPLTEGNDKGRVSAGARLLALTGLKDADLPALVLVLETVLGEAQPAPEDLAAALECVASAQKAAAFPEAAEQLRLCCLTALTLKAEAFRGAGIPEKRLRDILAALTADVESAECREMKVLAENMLLLAYEGGRE